MRLLGLLIALITATAGRADEAFERHVRPLLVEHCQGCHGPKKQMGGLRLDSREAVLRGGDGGPAVVVGKPAESRLVQAVRHEGDVKMPPRKRLAARDVAALEAWVRDGLKWGEERVVREKEAWRTHWAFQPVKRPARGGVDLLLSPKLAEKKLTFSPEADRRTLIRRLAFDLLGLPPSPEEVDSFVSDPRPDAYERLVERYLASPRHGERWGRYWLDVARYADTKGYVFFEESDYPWGWTYRDYVIEAVNHDLPYDRFVLEQLAADQLDLGKDRRPLRALGFLALGGRFMNNVHDILDDRIDVVTRGLMGLTVSCARCHDHKFDPVPTADYYALYGVFANTFEPTVPPLYEEPPATPAYAAFTKELDKREAALAGFVSQKFADLQRQARTRVGEFLLAAHARRGQPKADDFMLIADGNDINPTMLARWQTYLERTARAPHRVWRPWHECCACTEKDLPTKAFATDATINPHVARLFACPPASLAEVAQRHGKLFAEVALLTAPQSDPDLEELRQVLFGRDAPAALEPGEISNLELLPDRASQGRLQELGKAVEQWRAKGPGAPPRANVLHDRVQLREPVVFRRGNPNNPGETVPRRLPTLLTRGTPTPFRHGAGRLELARAIADRDNPLTARVLVNRVWLHHFGAGLVATPGDFGTRAEPPTHPELLDWLADEFVASGWSVKHLHRLMVTSAAYRQASVDRPEARAVDPENTLLWRVNRRPLDLEALRDSLLAVAGQLDGTVGGPSVRDALEPASRRRTLYGWVDRLNVPGLFRTFDFPSPDASSPKRDRTLVPQQALFLMNSPLALHAARTLSGRTTGTPEGRVRQMIRICYGRDAAGDEVAAAVAFVGSDAANWPRLAQALLLSNEFVFVD